jgi:hypothetical protein
MNIRHYNHYGDKKPILINYYMTFYSFLFLIGKNGKIDPLKTAGIDHLKFCPVKSKKLSFGNGV